MLILLWRLRKWDEIPEALSGNGNDGWASEIISLPYESIVRALNLRDLSRCIRPLDSIWTTLGT